MYTPRSPRVRPQLHSAAMRLPRWLLPLCALMAGSIGSAQGGSILREVYEGIPGTLVSDLTNAQSYPDQPTSSNLVTDFFESPTDVLDSYGQRMHGFILPPVSGNYTFWIASDDGGELWLSDSEDPGQAERIAEVIGWTPSRQWENQSNQRSAPIPLVAGRAYYISALMKEGAGGDNLAVRWLRPDGPDEGPIPATYLLPWGTAFEPPMITGEPADTVTVEGQAAVFEVQISPTTPATTQWQRNQVDLPGQTSPTLVYGPVTMADQGARFRARLTNSLGSAISREAILTVSPDTTRPTLVSAQNFGQTQLRVIFSEPVAEPGALVPGNYALDGGVAVTDVAWGADTRTVRLTTAPLTIGTTYQLTVDHVTDRAAAPNGILAGSQLSFLAVEYAPADVGSPSIPGGSVAVPGGFDVTGSGLDLEGDSDQLQFSHHEVSGDFDLAARVAGVTISDAFVRAGLMVRESTDADARYAAALASSAQIGCLFESRATTGSPRSTHVIQGGYPVNYPNTWLRLRRVGSTFYGFAGQDGTSWTQLGSVTLAGMPQVLMVGFAVSSEAPHGTTTASFRDVGPPPGTSAGTPIRPREQPGPAARSTGLVISEVMYHPADRSDERNLEFIEIYNGRSVTEDLTGWRISGDIDFEFPEGALLEAGAFAVIAANPSDIQAVYGITEVGGPYVGSLPNDGGRIRLRNGADAIRLEVNYADNPRWPVAADGAGHSLQLARPSWGQDAPAAWEASAAMGGSPGQVDAVAMDPWRGLVVNEFLAHTDLPLFDLVELFNTDTDVVDLSGCWLTDDPAAAADPAATNRFRIPDGTLLQPGAHLAFDESELGFALRAGGDEILLVNPDTTRVIDGLRFSAQENGVASGRSPDGAPTVRRLAAPSPAAANAPRRIEEVIIHEIMYHPLSDDSDDEFVELFNPGTEPVDVSGWKLGGGIDFEIPSPTTIPADGFLVVGRNAERLLSNHPHLTADGVRGNYQGSLGDGGDRISLRMPDQVVSTNEFGRVVTNRIAITVMEVTYADGGRWGELADGGGSSLELIDARADPLRAASWADSDESQKASWSTVTGRARMDHGNGNFGPDRLQLGMLGAGECLIDDVELYEDGAGNRVSNPGFEQGASGWSMQGNHHASTVDTGGAASGARCLHIRGEGDTDPGVNSIRTPLASGLSDGEMVNFRAKARWLGGWPEVLIRVRGNHVEFPVRMDVPTNLGTPGLPNSRRVANAGPAIFDVGHAPPVPQAGVPIIVTCRVSDPESIGSVQLRYRVDPGTSSGTLSMRDNGVGVDVRAGDGIYSAQLAGRSGGSLVAFRIEAVDDAGLPAETVFPEKYPDQECLVRWGDPIPFGNFTHYHMWSTAATESSRNSTPALDNTWHDATLVYNNDRVIYNARFRDKGSPWHGGSGDFAVTVPPDDRLLGATDRVFASTGNGGSEATGIRSQLASWLAQQLGIPYLHAQYMQLYRNGSQFRDIAEDLEQPNHDYAESWYPSGGEGDLYKVAMWFEFQDDNTSFSATSATIDRFTTLANEYKLARYRWIFQRRSNDGMASNYANLFELVDVINDTSGDYVSKVLNLVDMDQWMRAFGFNWITGNWDVWTYQVGQNIYAFKQPGARWVLMPWDIDFTFGLGDPPGTRLWGGQDGVMNGVYDTPGFRRMLWRCYQDAVDGPMLPERYQPQIDRRSVALRRNGVNVSSPDSIGSFIVGRRAYIQGQLAASDAPGFAITSNNGNSFVSGTQTVTLTGTAPFAVAVLEINGIPYTPSWLTDRTFQVEVPLAGTTNLLALQGFDRHGRPIPGATDTITVTYSGAIQQPEDYLVVNEVHYHPAEVDAGFVELYNRSGTTAFDLSGYRLDGVAYVFPDGAIIAPNGYLLVVSDRAGFSIAYGAGIPVFDQFPGSLGNGGESVALVRPGASPATDVVISDLRYDDDLPWPGAADGMGPSLQLLDPEQDTWRLANWGVTAIADPDRATPGRVNALRQTLPAFPELWINEVQPNNATGPMDPYGEREPWIELYNAGSQAVDLGGLYLTDSYTNLTAWAFPAGATIAAQDFLVVWADGETGESSIAAPHTSFRLDESSGSVALVRMQGSPLAPAVLDYLDYALLTPDRSIGAYPDGDPRRRRLLHNPTPGAANDPTSPTIQVTINEFMADNVFTLADPADGDYDDWFELHNAGSEAVDLTAYTLTDDLAQPNRFVIPPGYPIPPGGFLLVWADEELSQNVETHLDLHADFKLAAAGEQLGLYAPDGSLVDGLTFTPQTADESLGRYPDGALPPYLVMDAPTPRQPNFLVGGNRPPLLDPIGPRDAVETFPLTFPVSAFDPDVGQSLDFSLDAGAPAGTSIDAESGDFAWTPTEAQGPGTHFITIRVSDNGTPIRSTIERVAIQVAESNLPPVLAALTDQTVGEGSPLAILLQATDSDLPAQTLAFTLDPGAPAGAVVDADTGEFSWTPTEAQGQGTYSLTVRATDDGSPPLSHARSFQVTVDEVNNPPVLPVIQAQFTDELAPFTLAIQAVDPDTPPSALLYSLETAPAGAEIDAQTGALTWTPTEAQGPDNALFVVRATEISPPNLSASRTFSVHVTEINQAPTLDSLAPITVVEGEVVVAQATAADPDLPAQGLVYSLEPGAPAGAAIDPVMGQLVWATHPDQGTGTHRITIRVTDTGAGNLSDTGSVDVMVAPGFHTVIHEIMYNPVVPDTGYIELHNPSQQQSQSLAGIELRGTTLLYTFPENSELAPGEFLCIIADLPAFTTAYGDQVPVGGTWTGVLNAPDTLRLILPGTGSQPDTILDTVSFDRLAPWPPEADGRGAALQLVDPNRDNDRPGNWAATTAFAGSQTLVEMTANWRYFQDGAVPANWRNLSFEDEAWPQGDALLYVESASLPAAKQTPLNLGESTYYFRTRFTAPSAPIDAALWLTHIIDDGAVFWLNGQEIDRFNMFDGMPTHTTFTPTYIGDAVSEGPFAVPADALLPGDNVLAVEVHQTGLTSSDIVMGCRLELEGGTVATATPGAPNNVGAARSAFPTLRINEVQTRNLTGPTDRFGEREPWVEIVNTGPTNVNLDAVFLSDDPADLTAWGFPAGSTVPAGGFLVIFADGETAESNPDELHAGFPLPTSPDAPWWLCLAQRQDTRVVALDSLAGIVPALEPSTGRYPDGDPSTSLDFVILTPGAANPGPAVPVIVGAGIPIPGQPRLSWTTVPGRDYRIEYSIQLPPVSWQALMTIRADDDLEEADDGNAAEDPHRFYRVLLLP